MKKLFVYNTYREKVNYVSKYGEPEFDITSLEEGVGRTNKKVDGAYDLIVFVGNYVEGNIEEYMRDLENFYKDLEKFKLIHNQTKIH